MVVSGEDNLICDFAEYYHVYNWRALPIKTAATLAAGLPDRSRSFRAVTGLPCDIDTLLLAAAVDRLSLIWWSKTKDAEKGRNKPEMLTDRLMGKSEAKNTDLATFADADTFEAARAKFFKE